jgi:biopolymer transport protein ExbB
MTRRIALALGLLLLLPGLAQAWWNDKWSQRAQVTLNTTAAGAETKAALTNLPVLVRLHSGNFGFLDAKDDGSDLRFLAADDKTELKFHVEKWDPVNELALVWVQVPALAQGSNENSLWVYWGNAEAPAVADAKATYDSTFAGVYHFAEAQGLPQDATAGGSHAAAASAGRLPGTLIGPGLSFDGKQDVAIPADPGLRSGAGGMSVSLWANPAASDGTLFRQEEGGRAISLVLEGGVPVVRVSAGAAPLEVRAAAPLTNGTWHHVGFTLGGALTLYVDGRQAGTLPAQAVELGGQVTLGTGFAGQIDELQISRTARGADWFSVAAGGQGAEAKLVSVVAEAAAAGGQHAYFGILVENLTLDAWVVIVILIVMFFVACWVMFAKATMVNRVDRDNRVFLKRFREATHDFLDLGEARGFAGSTLFKLHQAGVHEIGKRFNGGQNDKVALSGASIDAIKAAIDADMVRETHRLNAQMVLLTIAISGGPFLGLLGTVVGVMITFAAIAAAGDVNVNAIAPGIAAALLATVAGLAVAIPALFGYNYLATRIKNISADMQIFVDEFVTRIAEVYSAR